MAFILVDTQALKDFREKGEECVKLFSEIKKDFEEYNRDFLAGFEGAGAEKYRTVSNLITEKVSDFEEVFHTICDCLVNPTLQNLEELDKYLDEQNTSMIAKEKAQSGDGTN